MEPYIVGIIIIIIIIIILEIVTHAQTETINTIQNPSIIDSSYSAVPRIIHRTWYSKFLTTKMYRQAYESWTRLNPTYTMIWNDDDDCENFMKKYGEREYKAWKRIIPTAYKADFWRACVLFLHGGVYVDSYAVAVESIDEIIKISGLQHEKDIFISALDADFSGGGIHNGFIICTPGHPIMKQYIDDMLINIDIGKEEEILSFTGPLCLARSINKYLKRDINTKHKVGLNESKYYLLVFYFGPYGEICDNRSTMLYKKYDILDCWIYQKFYKSLMKTSQSYTYMNSIGKICYDK